MSIPVRIAFLDRDGVQVRRRGDIRNGDPLGPKPFHQAGHDDLGLLRRFAGEGDLQQILEGIGVAGQLRRRLVGEVVF